MLTCGRAAPCRRASRQPRAAARLARALWIAWAVVVWNVVFDRVIVVAGRQYIVAAAGAAAADPAAPSAEHGRLDATRRSRAALWMATAAAGAILVIGFAAARLSAGIGPRDADQTADR